MEGDIHPVRSAATALAALSAILFATAALADGPAKLVDTAKGKVFADAKGMTLYYFDKDAMDVSNCFDKCAKNWPPLMAKASDKPDGEWMIIKRKDGSMQWAYEGKPVYLWVKDTKPGDITGDGVGGVWHIAQP